MSRDWVELPGLRVVVDAVRYRPDAQGSPDRPFVFQYDIAIHNDGPEPVTILARKWVVGDDSGSKLVVEGDGVVGETPRLGSGEVFRYHSFHTVASDSWAEGAYYGLTDDKRRAFVRIPRFALEL
jgi:ApaG protein